MSKKRLGWSGASRQIQARSEMPACARIRRIPGCRPVASTECRPSAGMPRPACTSTGRRRSFASANTGCSAGWSSVNCSARGCSLIPRAPRPSARSASESGSSCGSSRAKGNRRPSLRSASSMTMSLAAEYPSGSCIGKTNARASIRSSDPTQLLAAARVAVGVVEPDVGVGIERLDARHLVAQASRATGACPNPESRRVRLLSWFRAGSGPARRPRGRARACPRSARAGPARARSRC